MNVERAPLRDFEAGRKKGKKERKKDKKERSERVSE